MNDLTQYDVPDPSSLVVGRSSESSAKWSAAAVCSSWNIECMVSITNLSAILTAHSWSMVSIFFCARRPGRFAWTLWCSSGREALYPRGAPNVLIKRTTCLISWNFDTFHPLPLTLGRYVVKSFIREQIAASAFADSLCGSPHSQKVCCSIHASKQSRLSIVPNTARNSREASKLSRKSQRSILMRIIMHDIRNKAPDCSEHSTRVRFVIPLEKSVLGNDVRML